MTGTRGGSTSRGVTHGGMTSTTGEYNGPTLSTTGVKVFSTLAEQGFDILDWMRSLTISSCNVLAKAFETELSTIVVGTTGATGGVHGPATRGVVTAGPTHACDRTWNDHKYK